MRLNCFPPSSHDRIWHDSALRSELFGTYNNFRDAFKEQFGSAQSDLVAMEMQWNNVRQRPGDTVTTYYMHFSKPMSQLVSGHGVSKDEAIGRFQHSIHATLREEVLKHPLDKPDMDLFIYYITVHHCWNSVNCDDATSRLTVTRFDPKVNRMCRSLTL